MNDDVNFIQITHQSIELTEYDLLAHSSRMNYFRALKSDQLSMQSLRCFAMKSLRLFFISLLLLSFHSASVRADNIFSQNKNNQYLTEAAVNNRKNAEGPKHCVQKIELKTEHLFMKDNWQKHAEVETKEKWSKSVVKRFGTVYSNWKTAKNKKYECTRIGFGNDKAGNIGASVICLIEAEPCVILLTK